MTSRSTAQKADALLATHGWEVREDSYVHKDGYSFAFPPRPSPPDGKASPSLLLAHNGCSRKLYLHRNPTHESVTYTNLFGEPARPHRSFVSPWAVKGTVVHTALYCVAECLLDSARELTGLAWRTALAPAIHHSIMDAVKEFGERTPGVDPLADIDTTPGDLERLVTRVVDEVWCREIGGFRFSPREWRDQLSLLDLEGEVPLVRGDFAGICDLLARQDGEALVADYKTGRLDSQTHSDRFTDEDTCAILNSPEHALHPYLLQVAAYCWMISEERECSRAWLVHLQNPGPNTLKFNVGKLSKEAIEGFVNIILAEVRELEMSTTVPDGTYDPYVCGFCPFRMNCPAFLSASETTDTQGWFEENPGRELPVLLPVQRVIPNASTVIVHENLDRISVRLIGPHRTWLRLAEDALAGGSRLVACLRLRGSLDRPYSYDVEFARCG